MAGVVSDDGASQNYTGPKFCAELEDQGAIRSAAYVRWMIVQTANVIAEDG